VRTGRDFAGKRLFVEQSGHAGAVQVQVDLPLTDVVGQGPADGQGRGAFWGGFRVRQSLTLYLWGQSLTP
jgi:hypothetical protein